jgi:hypothetical protein
MKQTVVYLPVFKMSQLLPYMKEPTTVDCIFKDNIINALQSFESTNPLEDAVMVCVREKDGDDYKMSIAIMPLDSCQYGASFGIHSYKKIKNVLVNIEGEVLQAIKRMGKIASFI